MPAIPEPTWSRDRPDQNGFWMTLSRPLRNAHYWVYLLHGMIVSPIVSIVTFTLTTVWLSISLGGLTYWFWAAFIPRRYGTGEWGQYVSAAVPWLFGGWSSWAVEVVLYLLAGIVFAITLPWAWAAWRAPTTRSPGACSVAGRRMTWLPRSSPRQPRARGRRAGRRRRAAAPRARHP